MINSVKALAKLLYNRVYINPRLERDIILRFHKLYYDAHDFGKTWSNTSWLGVITQKCPLDLWIYQEIIFDMKPDVIIECGTHMGGSALFLASMCDLVNNGKVITIDIQNKKNRPKHERITYLAGSSTDSRIFKKVKSFIRDKDKVLVILDSDHSRDHVLDEMKIYNQFVTKGSYLIVEDTNLNNHPVAPEFGPGPMEAVNDFLKTDKNFIIDKAKEKFYLTFNPRGYLKRIN